MTASELIAGVKADKIMYLEFLQKLELVEPRLTQAQYQECIDHLRRPRSLGRRATKQKGSEP